MLTVISQILLPTISLEGLYTWIKERAWLFSQAVKTYFKKGGFIPKQEGIRINKIVKEDAVVPPKGMFEKESNDGWAAGSL